MKFEVEASDAGSRARLGSVVLPHGTVRTPVFMPVATQATVKTVTPDELERSGTEMVVCNTYHLLLRPGQRRIQSLGGLSEFMGWHKPILTDSGGFQIHSLAALTRVTDEGVDFQSHVDGTRYFLKPEEVVGIQQVLGSDVAMCLDECLPYPVSRGRAEEAARRTAEWARRSRHAKADSTNLFAIVQGATYGDLRRQNATELAELDFPGYAVGGLCLGEPSALTYEMVDEVAEVLPADRPRYLMGAGYPEDIVAAVARGVDMFDCVLPTRNGRTGTAFTSEGRVSIRNARHSEDPRPLDEDCGCYTCRTFSRAYLRHLFIVGEALGPRLLTLHNIWHFQALMGEIRGALGRGGFAAWSRDFLDRSQTEEDTNQEAVRNEL